MGSFSNYMVLHCNCDVLVVKRRDKNREPLTPPVEEIIEKEEKEVQCVENGGVVGVEEDKEKKDKTNVLNEQNNQNTIVI